MFFIFITTIAAVIIILSVQGTVFFVLLGKKPEKIQDVEAQIEELGLPASVGEIRRAMLNDSSPEMIEKVKQAARLRAQGGNTSVIEEFLRRAGVWNQDQRAQLWQTFFRVSIAGSAVGAILLVILCRCAVGFPLGLLLGLLGGIGVQFGVLCARIQALEIEVLDEIPFAVEKLLGFLDSTPDIVFSLRKLASALEAGDFSSPLSVVIREAERQEREGKDFLRSFREQCSRTGQRSLRTFAAILVQSDRHGADRTRQLRELSSMARNRRLQRKSFPLPETLLGSFELFPESVGGWAPNGITTPSRSEWILFLRSFQSFLKNGLTGDHAFIQAVQSSSEHSYFRQECERLLQRKSQSNEEVDPGGGIPILRFGENDNSPEMKRFRSLLQELSDNPNAIAGQVQELIEMLTAGSR